MKFSYLWLQSYFKKKLPSPDKLAEILSDHFANVEKIKKDKGDFVLDIEIRPNRAGDCFGHWGVAREIAAILRLSLNLPSPTLRKDKREKTGSLVALEINDSRACPRYSTIVIKEVRVGPSPLWLKKRLEVCGLQSINNIVDIANYVMLETNQPLHAFDWEKISEETNKKTIIVRFAKDGEKMTTLDDKTYELSEDILVIASQSGPLAIAGIKGGRNSGIDGKTKTVVLEGANFNPLVIRRASQKLKLKTDASWRFEHGLSPDLIEPSLERTAQLIQEIAGGKPAKEIVDFYPVKRKATLIKLETSIIGSLLGIDIPSKEVKRILVSLGFKIKATAGFLLVETPISRVDISIPENLVEEVGRIWGYKNIPYQPPAVLLLPPLENKDVFWEEKTRDSFAKAGFSEVWNYSFLQNKAAKTFGFKKENLVELENPLDENRPYLVPSLLPSLLANVAFNSKFFKTVKIFELGRVFFRNQDAKLSEERRVAAAVWGKGEQGFWELKGCLELFLSELGIVDFDCEKTDRSDIFDKGGVFKIKAGRETIGNFGKLRTDIEKLLEIDGFVFALEMNFEKLTPLFSSEKIYHSLSKHPPTKRDLALLVPTKTRAKEILSLIESLKIPVLSKTELFDIYQGKELPEEKKNFAFRLTFRSKEKTLSSEEIELALGKIIKAAEVRGWKIR